MDASKDRRDSADKDDGWSEPAVRLSKDPDDDRVSVIAIELPGVAKGSVRLTLSDEGLKLEAEGTHRCFRGTIALPEELRSAVEENVQASMEDGLLTLRLDPSAGPTEAVAEGGPTVAAETGGPQEGGGDAAAVSGDEPSGGEKPAEGAGTPEASAQVDGEGQKLEGEAQKGEVPVSGGSSGELERLGDQLLRLRADFDNFRKRARKEKEEYATRRLTDMLLGVLEVTDALDRAVATSNGCRDPDKINRGLELIRQQARTVMEGMSVTALDPVGSPFDPAVHEAVESVKDPGREDGTVDATIAKGYMFGEALLRPARVRVVRND
jgi:molecular chaperone GrpE